MWRQASGQRPGEAQRRPPRIAAATRRSRPEGRPGRHPGALRSCARSVSAGHPLAQPSASTAFWPRLPVEPVTRICDAAAKFKIQRISGSAGSRARFRLFLWSRRARSPARPCTSRRNRSRPTVCETRGNRPRLCQSGRTSCRRRRCRTRSRAYDGRLLDRVDVLEVDMRNPVGVFARQREQIHPCQRACAVSMHTLSVSASISDSRRSCSSSKSQ